MSTTNQFPAALDAAIEASGLKRGVVAQRLDIHPSTLMRYCQGKLTLPAKRLADVAEVLHLDEAGLAALQDAYVGRGAS